MSGVSTISSSASPGPEEPTRSSSPYAPPETVKNMMNTRALSVSERLTTVTWMGGACPSGAAVIATRSPSSQAWFGAS